MVCKNAKLSTEPRVEGAAAADLPMYYFTSKIDQLSGSARYIQFLDLRTHTGILHGM